MKQSLAFGLLLISLPLRASSAQHPIVPVYERFAGKELKDVAAGRLLMGELGCAACHRDQGGEEMMKPAPILDGVGSRVRARHLLKFIANPSTTKQGTTMPRLFAGKSKAQTAREVEAIVHYLKSLSPAPPEQVYASASGRVRGEDLFHKVGCVACHAPRKKGAPKLGSSKPLGDLPAKYTLVSLASFLRDPHKTRPGGRMPSLNLTARESYEIAAYLLPNVPQKSGISFEVFKGGFDKLPDFSKLKPVASGDTELIDIKVTKERDDFALRFEGVLPVGKAGEYTFHTLSDDGSKLYVNGKVIVNNDGVHPEQRRAGKIALKPGKYQIVVEFFERGGGERIHVEYEGPGVKRQLLAPALMAGKPDEPLENLAFQVDKQLAAQGRVLFKSVGCSTCHQLQEKGQRVAARTAAKDLRNLRSNGGCLAASPQPGLPHYGLNEKQRASISAALEAEVREPSVGTPTTRTAATLAAFNCYACHSRSERGGVEQPRQQFFQTTQPEMGIEGSIPPSLDGVGAKLTTLWLRNIVAEGAKDRPYMHTRMPKFGSGNVGHLVADLPKTDHIIPPPRIDLAATRAVKADGWKMIGARGLSCIKCHTFGRFRATGVQSIDMSVMTKRLREDWFRSYVRNPQRYRKGTRMPSAWPPAPNKSFLRDILDADSEKQIKAVWHYLSDGPRARTPFGLVTNSMELFATNEAVIYRNFIQDAGARAIGVGYPEGLNLAFDANELRLALIWQGAFIDAKKHWTGRGQGFQGPAGSKVQKLGAGSSFATLASDDAPWPSKSARELGYRFRGYELSDDRRPTFRYEIEGFQIEDFPNAVDKGVKAIFKRKIQISGGKPGARLYYRAAVGQIEKKGPTSYQVGDLKLTINGGQAIVRKNELLVLVTAGTELLQTYEW